MIYYNENEPYCVEWLRNLIREGLLPEGDVDDRSIEEVEPADLRGYSQCHFFAGIGGWAYALQLAMFPDDRYVWTGSCPCQPFSSAGKQNGAADERHLWPVWFRLIRECRPSVVFGEQVAQAISWGWLDAVYADLEAEGYACAASVLPACSVGAPHIRQRLWFVADSGLSQRQRWPGEFRPIGAGEAERGEEVVKRERGGATGVMADAAVHGHTATENGRGVRAKQEERRVQQSSGVGDAGVVADSTSERRHPTRRTGQASDESGAQQRPDGLRDAGFMADPRGGRPGIGADIGQERQPDKQKQHEDLWREFVGQGTTGVMADAGFATRERYTGGISGKETEISRAWQQHGDMPDRPESGGATRIMGDSPGGRLTRPHGAEVEEYRTQPASPWVDVTWLPCADGKARPTQPGIFPLAHGIPARVGKLRAAGNAICPQAAQAFIEAYMEC